MLHNCLCNTGLVHRCHLRWCNFFLSKQIFIKIWKIFLNSLASNKWVKHRFPCEYRSLEFRNIEFRIFMRKIKFPLQNIIVTWLNYINVKFLKVSQTSQENTCLRASFLIKLQLRPATLLKRKIWHRCFPVNFVKFLRTPILQNISGRLLLSRIYI